MSQPEFPVSVSLEGKVAPSEDPLKVKTAMANVLGDTGYSVEERERSVRFTSDNTQTLRRLHDQLRDRHVRAAARKLLYRGREGKRTTILLNRQAAHSGVLVLCGSESESPLGPLYLTIESVELDKLIEWLTAYEAE